ncbi:MAG: hypothetical protein ACYTFW_25470, partial [Planctomycetota bacterium]
MIQSFVRLGKDTGQGDPATKQGYNTSGRPVQYEENTSPSFTHDLPLASIPLFYYDVDLDGTPEAYYEFRLDINESDTNLARWLSVDAIQIWQSDTPGLHSGFIPATDHADQTSYTGSLTVGFTSDGDSYLVYNMDEGDVNNWVAMNYTLNEGSGVADMVLLVPVEFFNQDLEFVYLYSQFGAQTGTSDIEWDSNGDFIVDQTLYGRTWEQDDGFEEWAITAEIPGTKSGIKFLDLNGDGIRDADGIDNIPDNADDEVGLAGWTIYVYEDEDASGLLDSGETNLVASVLTANGTTDDLDGDGVIDPVGFYWFELESVTLKEVKVKGEVVGYTPEGGYYIVLEEARAGWIQSTPTTDVINDGSAPGATEYGYAISMGPGERETGNDFGNYELATKSGVKFHDLDGDGAAREAGEPGLTGWTIYVDYNDNGTLDALEPFATTTADGSYTITNILPGTWKVREVAQAGWTNSFPAASDAFGRYHEETFTSGADLTGNDFGNYQQATKTGTKFEDTDGMGPGTSGTGLDGWEIRAYADTNSDSDGDLDQAEYNAGPADTDTTSGGGNYSLTLDPGDYIVVEVMETDWFQSYPGTGYEVLDAGLVPVAETLGAYGYAITLSSGEL